MQASKKSRLVVMMGMLTAGVVSAAVAACETPATAPAEATPAASIAPDGTRMKISAGDPRLGQQAEEAARAAEAAGALKPRTRQRRPATAEELAEMEASAPAEGVRTRQRQPE